MHRKDDNSDSEESKLIENAEKEGMYCNFSSMGSKWVVGTRQRCSFCFAGSEMDDESTTHLVYHAYNLRKLHIRRRAIGRGTGRRKFVRGGSEDRAVGTFD
ncbi:uncharacterized protein LOC108340638 isoform X2 [Vigna angularis]|uniref:uncharacterized protein LOC108340638 isoform X2 n=1 Tax=Phaseolus angularis TaxID=3914 RepID=UPI00080A4CE9|nr:uncharacterized protein LOC108340638 isoform X2 [Vigna angularis]